MPQNRSRLLASFMCAGLFAAGCDRKAASNNTATTTTATTTTATFDAKTPKISASPNPVPAGDGLGTTTITWSAGGPWAQVYISQDGKDDTTMFTEGSHGNTDAPWIKTGHTYEFRLFAGKDHKQLLDKVLVTRAK